MVGAAVSAEGLAKGLAKGPIGGLHAPACCRDFSSQGVAVRSLIKSVRPAARKRCKAARKQVAGSLGEFAGQRVSADRQHKRSGVQCVHISPRQSRNGPEEGGWDDLFQVPDPREQGGKLKNNWDVVLNDVRYLDWRARQDVYAIKAAHDKVVETLNPVAREHKSVSTLKSQLAALQDELSKAHAQLRVSEVRVEHTLSKLTEMEDKLMETLPPQQRSQAQTQEPPCAEPATREIADEVQQEVARRQRRAGQKSFLDVSGKPKMSPALKNFWYPVAFSDNVDSKTMVPIDCFNEPWVIFRDQDGKAGCIRDECAHRACPLSLGSLVDGKVQCPYHGWEYNTTGECTHMPSTVQAPTSVRALPCVEQDGMIWIWPGDKVPEASLPDLSPPSGYTIHAQITLEVPVEHGLLVENLLDLAHAPFTHTTTFAKGWPVPNSVKFKTAAAAALSGFWDPYPIDMEFRPPCMVFSTIGLSQPGKLSGTNTKDCPNHLHQLHVCVPSKTGTTRLLYRMSLDFAWWAKYVPFIHKLWEYMANQVLSEDLRLVEGQQDRMLRGANVWNHPVAYDKLGVRYRRWRQQQEDATSGSGQSEIEDDFD